MKTGTKILGIGMTQANVPKTMDGRKTNTRRIEACLRGLAGVPSMVAKRETCRNGELVFTIQEGIKFHIVKPRHQIGDRLYVKEALQRSSEEPPYWATYKTDSKVVLDGYDEKRQWESDDANEWKNKVIPARYMPRSAARTFIEITDVRCERIQEITESDAKAEGANRPYGRSPDAYDKYGTPEGIGFSYKLGFQKLWNDTNGKDAWERNDWVFAYTFKLVEAPQ